MNHRNIWIVALLCLQVLSCASKPEGIRFDLPPPKAAAQKGVQVLLRPPEDRRRFNENLSAPDAASVNARPDRAAAIQARAVGRKRNMYNEPEGELLLGRRDSVSDLTARLAANTLTGMGYAVVEDPLEASPEAATMEIVIEDLWLWNRAEAFHNIVQGRLVIYVSLESNEAESNEVSPVRIDATAERKTRVPGRYDWQEVLGELCTKATEKLQAMLEKSPPTPRTPDFSQTEPDTDTGIGVSNTPDTDTDTDTDTVAHAEMDTGTTPAAVTAATPATDTADTDSATAPEAAPTAP